MAPVAGESTKLRRGERPPAITALWDGSAVQLRGVRGEVLGLQVLAPGPARLELPRDVCEVTGFNLRTLEVREPSTDLYGPSRGAGAYPDLLDPAPGDAPGADGAQAYFDVAIRRGARAGTYAGRLLLGGRELQVVLRVEPPAIDLARSLEVWVFYLPVEIARAHGVPDDDGAAELAWEKRYAELFLAHGCLLASDLPAARARLRPLPEGARFRPVALDVTSDARIRESVAAIRALPGPTPFAIPVDEPRTPAARARVRHIGQVVAEAGGGGGALLRAVTAPPSPDYDDAVDVFLSPEPIRDGARPPAGKHYWTYNGRPPRAGSMILDTDGTALRTWGWIGFRYDVALWHAWEGLYFHDRYNSGGPTSVTTDPDTFDERRKGGSDHGNLDGLLVYPGPRPSLRLKALRRGLQDRLLLEALAGCGGADEARALARRVVPVALGDAPRRSGPGAWPHDERVFEAARHELLDALARRCKETP